MVRITALNGPFAGLKAGFPFLLHRFARAVALWRQRSRTRAALRDLPPHLLRDIGLTRAEADAEARRMFWEV